MRRTETFFVSATGKMQALRVGVWKIRTGGWPGGGVSVDARWQQLRSSLLDRLAAGDRTPRTDLATPLVLVAVVPPCCHRTAEEQIAATMDYGARPAELDPFAM